MATPEEKTDAVHSTGVNAPGVEQMVSRRRLVQNSALTAGALALASRIDRQDALAQDATGTPSAQPPAGRVLDFDFPGLEIGVAAYPEIPTGCTVFNFDVDMFPAGVMLELDVRGRAPWHSGAEDIANAISLAGGSVYGLEAAAGVAAELFAQGGYRDLVAVSGSRHLRRLRGRGAEWLPQQGDLSGQSARPGSGAGAATGAFPSGEPGCGQRGLCRPVGELALSSESAAGRAAPSARSARSKLLCSPSSMRWG